jgi:hypothetical protein
MALHCTEILRRIRSVFLYPIVVIVCVLRVFQVLTLRVRSNGQTSRSPWCLICTPATAIHSLYVLPPMYNSLAHFQVEQSTHDISTTVAQLKYILSRWLWICIFQHIFQIQECRSSSNLQPPRSLDWWPLLPPAAHALPVEGLEDLSLNLSYITQMTSTTKFVVVRTFSVRESVSLPFDRWIPPICNEKFACPQPRITKR